MFTLLWLGWDFIKKVKIKRKLTKMVLMNVCVPSFFIRFIRVRSWSVPLHFSQSDGLVIYRSWSEKNVSFIGMNFFIKESKQTLNIRSSMVRFDDFISSSCRLGRLWDDLLIWWVLFIQCRNLPSQWTFEKKMICNRFVQGLKIKSNFIFETFENYSFEIIERKIFTNLKYSQWNWRINLHHMVLTSSNVTSCTISVHLKSRLIRFAFLSVTYWNILVNRIFIRIGFSIFFFSSSWACVFNKRFMALYHSVSSPLTVRPKETKSANPQTKRLKIKFIFFSIN